MSSLKRHAFRAMGTDVELLVETADPTVSTAFGAAEHEFERIEDRFSRFRENSELVQLNRTGAGAVSTEMIDLIEIALDARRRTGGAFDPTVHDAVVASGYDRSFDLIDRPSARAESAPCGGTITLDRRASRITLEAGTRLDLGGIAKGYAVDRVARGLAAAGPCLVNAGGDIAATGTPASGAWHVGVPTGDGAITLALAGGGVATSGRDRRWWTCDGEARHHLIDPSTGRPSTSDLLRVTVIGRSAVEAEVLAKYLYLLGSHGAARAADRDRIPAVLVTDTGRTRYAGGLG